MISRAAVATSIFLLMSAFLLSPCGAAESPNTPVKIAILPFSMHTPSDLNYLQSGVREMLTSRLAWQGKVQVLDRAQSEQAVRGAKDISLADALKAGSALKADYVLFGSITAMGQSVSIDAKMAAVSGKTEPVSFYAQTKSLDEVIPQVNQFAQEINQKVFARPGEKSQSAAASEADLATRNPELLIPGMVGGGDKISYLNPNFIEVTPEGSLRQPGLWRSQDLPDAILGMDIGDLDGDGRQEIVAMTRNKLTVYRKENQALRAVATFGGTQVDRFLWVCVSDLRRDGRSLIFLTNLRQRNSSKPTVDAALSNVDFREEVSSSVLALEGGKLKVVASGIRYFLNTVYMGQRGKVLMGQQQGAPTDAPFQGDVMEMQLRGSSLEPITPVRLPKQCNVFNFAKADIKNVKADETLVLDESHRLLIVNAAGDMTWKGDKIFAATTNAFEGKVVDRRYNQVDMFFLPSPILITDLNKDGIPEVMLNRNATTFEKFLPDSMKYYDKGEIVSLSWDQMGLIENWKTRELGGMVTALRVGDFNGDGTVQLIISLVHAKDLLKMSGSKSTIFSYDLNIAPSKTAEAKQK